MKRALVTGATGFIGFHVAQALAASGVEVRCLVRRSSNVRALEALGVRLVTGDLGDPASLGAALDGADTVLHLASLLKMPWKPEFRTVNIGGTEALARAAAARDRPPVLVVVSSLAAAGPSAAGCAHTEDDPPRPISLYGRMKLDAERAAAAFARDLPLSIVRPPMVFGEGDRYGLALFRSVDRGLHVLPSRQDPQLSLVHAMDLAAALLLIAERGERADGLSSDGPRGRGVYYVADEARLSYGALGGVIAQAMEVPAPRVVALPSWAGGLAAGAGELWARVRDRPTILNRDKHREATAGSWTCNPAKVRSDLGFQPGALMERLAQTARAYRAAGWLRSR